MLQGQACNFSYGLDVEFTNCPDSRQVINTIQIAYNSNPEDVIIVFFPMNDDYHSALKDEIKSTSNALITFLTSRRHVKIGVNIIDDIAKIEREFSIRISNYIDVQSMAISLNVYNKSMNDLGEMFIPNYTPKVKPGGGYMTLDQKKIVYAANDAVTSLLLYYHILGASSKFLNTMKTASVKIPIDRETEEFAVEFFNRINRVRFDGFINHMHSCYSKWCKLLSKDEVITLSRELLNKLKTEGVILSDKGFYMINRKLKKERIS